MYTLSLHDALPISIGLKFRTFGARTCFRLKASSWRVRDRKSTRLNSSHVKISYAVFCLKKKIMVTLHEVITFLVSMQISISSLQTHNVNRCGRSRHFSLKLSLRRQRCTLFPYTTLFRSRSG